LESSDKPPNHPIQRDGIRAVERRNDLKRKQVYKPQREGGQFLRFGLRQPKPGKAKKSQIEKNEEKTGTTIIKALANLTMQTITRQSVESPVYNGLFQEIPRVEAVGLGIRKIWFRRGIVLPSETGERPCDELAGGTRKAFGRRKYATGMCLALL